MNDIVKLNGSKEFDYLIGKTFGSCDPFVPKATIRFANFSDPNMDKKVYITLYSINPLYYETKNNFYIQELYLKNISGDIFALVNQEISSVVFTYKYNPGSNKYHPKLIIYTDIGKVIFNWHPLPQNDKLGYVVLPIEFKQNT